jgi:hypothetical protein
LGGGCVAQTDSVQSPSIERLLVIGAGTTAAITASHLQNFNSWWKGERSAFHLSGSEGYTLGIDKIKHMYCSYVISDLMGKAFGWAGVQAKKALLYGGGMSLLLATYVEIGDGFTKRQGFSIGDECADILGAALPFARETFPWLQLIDFKWSVYPSEPYRRGKYQTVIADYESHFYWASIDMYSLLPSSLRSYWLPFINIAIGYSIENMTEGKTPRRALFISLDLNTKKLPGDAAVWNTIKQALSYFHLPAPAIKIAPGYIAYGLHF